MATIRSTVLFLGASADIARPLLHLFAEKNYDLQLAGRNLSELALTAKDIEIRHRVSTQVLVWDAMDFGKHKDFFQELRTLPEIVIVAAGYLGAQEIAISEQEAFLKIIQTNFTGLATTINLLANAMEKRGSGVIVGISSVAGERGRQSNYVYGSAKSAFTAYLSGLRNRLYKKSVHVMTVIPGYVNTRMTAQMDLPKLLTAEPEKLAKRIFKSIKKRKNVVYYLGIWRLIMLLIRNIPEFVFKRLSL